MVLKKVLGQRKGKVLLLGSEEGWWQSNCIEVSTAAAVKSEVGQVHVIWGTQNACSENVYASALCTEF